MIVAYLPIFELREDDHEEAPSLFVGERGQFLVSMKSSNFKVSYESGKASVYLSRYMTPVQARNLAHAILESADKAIAGAATPESI